MSVRRPLLLLCCAFALGLAASALVACGGTKDGIPASNAASLNKELGDVQAFVERGDCGGLNGQLRQVQEGIDNLPSSVDAALVSDLNDGLDRLYQQSVADCNADTTETTDTTTVPAETTVETTPATTTQPPPATTPTQPTPTPTEPTPEPEPTPPPQTDPGGATPPGQDPNNPGGAGVGDGTEVVP